MPKERFTVKGQDAFTRYEKTQAAKRWLATRYQGVNIPMADIDRLVDLLDVLLINLQDGDALVYDADTSKWVNGSGGSSAAADILVVEWRGTMTDCSKNSDGVVPQFADFTVDYLKGTDLSIIDDSDAPGAAAFVSASGGSFGIQTYMGLRLTADAGSSVQRFIQFYTSNPYGFPIPDLGSDLLLPLIDGYTIDTSCTSLPYFDVAAGQAFGKPSFFGAAGVAADTVALFIIMTCWSM